MNTHKDIYINIGKRLESIIEESFSKKENEILFSKIAAFHDDYEHWINLVKDNNEALIYTEALTNYKMMLLFISEGLYKNAYMLLRGYLEFTLFGVRLSSNDWEFRKWKHGDREADVSWAKIMDCEDGILGKKYINAYNSILQEDASLIRQKAGILYRECSEYIHNGYSICKDFDVAFDEDTFKKICMEVVEINKIIVFAFCIRYYDKMKEFKVDNLFDVIREYLNEYKTIHILLEEKSSE